MVVHNKKSTSTKPKSRTPSKAQQQLQQQQPSRLANNNNNNAGGGGQPARRSSMLLESAATTTKSPLDAAVGERPPRASRQLSLRTANAMRRAAQIKHWTDHQHKLIHVDAKDDNGAAVQVVVKHRASRDALWESVATMPETDSPSCSGSIERCVRTSRTSAATEFPETARCSTGDGDVSAGATPLTSPQTRRSSAHNTQTDFAADDDDDFNNTNGLEAMPRFVIHPASTSKLLWDVVVSTCIVWSTMTVPYFMCFDVHPSLRCMREVFVVDFFVDSCFWLDIALSFCTAYQDETGNMVKNHRQIALQYFPNFVVDFVSTFPFELIQKGLDVTRPCSGKRDDGSSSSKSGSLSILRSARLFRIVRLSKLFKLAKVSRLGRNNTALASSDERKVDVNPAIIAILKMLFQLFFVGHLIACVRHGLTQNEYEDTTHWKHDMEQRRGGEPYARRHLYVLSLYWAFTTMTTVGYGDVVVSSNREKLLAIFTMIVGGASFGYIIGSITSLLENFNQSASLYREKIDMVKAYVYDRQFPTGLGIKVVRHFKHVYSRQTCFDRDRIFENLPTGLALDLAHVEHRALLADVPFLAKSPRPFAAAVAPHALPCLVDKNDFLFFQNEVCTHLYCIAAGTARHVRAASSKKTPTGMMMTLAPHTNMIETGVSGPGDLVALEAILVTTTHAFTAVATTTLSFYIIPKEVLTQQLEDHPTVRAALVRDADAELVKLDAETFSTTKEKAGGEPSEASAFLSTKPTCTPNAITNDDEEDEDDDEHSDEAAVVVADKRAFPPQYESRGGIKLAALQQRPEPRVVPLGGANDDQKGASAAAPSAAAAAAAAAAANNNNNNNDPRDAVDEAEAPTAAPPSTTNCSKYRVPPLATPMLGGQPPKLKPLADAPAAAAAAAAAAKSRSEEAELARSDSAEKIKLIVTPLELWQRTRVFHPEAYPKVVWDCVVCVLILFSVLVVTYRIGFSVELEKKDEPWFTLEYLIDGLFALDIGICFNTAFISDVMLISGRYEIAKQYIKGWFWVDLLSTLPLDRLHTLSSGGNSQFLGSLRLLKSLRLIRIAKITRVMKLHNMVDTLEELCGINPAVLKPVKPMIITTFVAHLFSCVFFNAGRRFRRCHRGSWLDERCVWHSPSNRGDVVVAVVNNSTEASSSFSGCSSHACGGNEAMVPLRDADRYTQYVTTLYWAFATMTTVGYGDVAPSTENVDGMILVIVCQVLGTMLFAYLIGVVVDLVTNLDPMERRRKQGVDILGEFVRDQRLSAQVGRSMFKNHAFHGDFRGVYDESEIMDKLPPKLRNQCCLFVHCRTLASAPFLCELEAQYPGSAAVVMAKLKPVAYVRDQIINDPHINARELHFVLEGSVYVRHKYATDPANARIKELPTIEQQVFRIEARRHFGQATILVPADTAFNLNVEVACRAPRTTALVLAKLDYDDIKENYQPIFNYMDHTLRAAAAATSEWIHLLDETNLVDGPRR
ncbi:hypothetical protein CTAYLR_000080 [Chrysophaeum taylorii]|uniref:Cyclic nucleotide-binding domain-containing protein n=1 Tax=Chrysophaeum taylorii TaxID=2483200 RepID=A0AAD7UIV7_9STRA|nr:hypothetical protein CTAYLR_000080 [Chrysophaeum taylorii]